MRNNKKIVRLTEADLARLVKRVMDEGVTLEMVKTPKDFAQQNNGKKGTWEVKDYKLYLGQVDGKNYSLIDC